MFARKVIFRSVAASEISPFDFCRASIAAQLHGAQTDVGNREFLHEYNAVCGKSGVKHHCRTTLNLKSR